MPARAQAPRRVLFLSFLHPEIVRGGAQEVAYELFKAASADPNWLATFLAGCDPTTIPRLVKSGAFITGFDGRPNEHLYFGHGFDYFLLRNLNPLAIDRYRQFLREIRPDVVHFHHVLMLGSDLLTVTRAECPNARIVFTFHEFIAVCHAKGQMLRTIDGALCGYASSYRCHECFPEVSPDHFFVRQRYLQEHLSNVDLFVAPSNLVRERYIAWGIPAERIRVIPNGQTNLAKVSSRARREPSGRASKKRFGFFGQLIDNKGLHVLLDAAARMVKSDITDFEVHVFGGNREFATPEYVKRIDALVSELEELGFTGLDFHGRYDHAELPRLMSLVDWVVVPSTWWEIFGLVVSEAWMFGKPVIASDIGGLAERVHHRQNGLLFAAGSASELAATMQECLEKPEMWAELSARCKAPLSPEEAWRMHLDGLEIPVAWPP